MSELRFHPDKEGRLMLPERCGIVVSCYETEEARQAVTAAMEQAQNEPVYPQGR